MLPLRFVGYRSLLMFEPAIATAASGNYLGHIGAKKPHVRIGEYQHGEQIFRVASRPYWGGTLMDFGGRYIIAAPRAAVWAALNDAAVLKAAIPGCHKIEWVSQDALDLEIKASLGVINPTFKGELRLSDITPAERYTLSGRGKGGLLGMAEGAADILLTDHGAETMLVFQAHGGASGQIMKLGKAIIGNSAQRIIDGFFERFGTAMGAAVTPLPPEFTAG